MTTADACRPGVFSVDPDELRVAFATLDDVAIALTHVRARMREVTADAPAWAGRSTLLAAVSALAEAVDRSAQRGVAEATELASALALAAQRYGDVEQRAVESTRGGEVGRRDASGDA